MRDRFGIFGAVIRIRKLSLLLVMTLRMPNRGTTLWRWRKLDRCSLVSSHFHELMPLIDSILISVILDEPNASSSSSLVALFSHRI
jgi:hypothetical protein